MAMKYCAAKSFDSAKCIINICRRLANVRGDRVQKQNCADREGRRSWFGFSLHSVYKATDTIVQLLLLFCCFIVVGVVCVVVVVFAVRFRLFSGIQLN